VTAYFDDLERGVHTISDETRGDDDAFLDRVGVIEKTLSETARLNSGDREFPHGLREQVMRAIAIHAIDSTFADDHPAAPWRMALALRRSQLVGELHRIFHDLAGLRIKTRFGFWTDDPASNLKARDAHDESR